MTDIQLYTKLSSLPSNLKNEVLDFIDFLKSKSNRRLGKEQHRVAGKAIGLIEMKDNFDDPLDSFKEYL